MASEALPPVEPCVTVRPRRRAKRIAIARHSDAPLVFIGVLFFRLVPPRRLRSGRRLKLAPLRMEPRQVDRVGGVKTPPPTPPGVRFPHRAVHEVASRCHRSRSGIKPAHLMRALFTHWFKDGLLEAFQGLRTLKARSAYLLGTPPFSSMVNRLRGVFHCVQSHCRSRRRIHLSRVSS